MKQKLSCLEETRKAVWGDNRGLGLLSHLGPWRDCCLRCKYEFPGLSGHFTGKLKTICPLAAAQQRIDDATGPRSRKHDGFNGKMCLLEVARSVSPDLNPVEMLRHDLAIAMQTRRPKNAAEMKPLYKERGYCCQRRVNQLLIPRVHTLFPPWFWLKAWIFM